MESWITAKAESLRETAIERMRQKDFDGGRKLALEAQKLCPTLEDMDRMIVVCNVHCAAAEGNDLYKILGVAAEADESAVISQCSRMALALHPDNNKSPGAAEAFQLFLKAKKVLLNNEKRRVYDKAMGEIDQMAEKILARIMNNPQNLQLLNQQLNLSRGRGSKLNEASKTEESMRLSRKEYLLNLDLNAQPSGDHIDGEETDRKGKRVVEFEPSPEIEPDSKILEYSDAEFHDFKKEKCIARLGEGQVWAAYDTLDAMPRFYALINSISDDHTIHITWLNPLPNNDDEKQWLYQGLPASTGRFVHGYTDTLEVHAVFSHLVNCKRDPVLKKVHEIHPKKGETWAVFKYWDIRSFGGYEYEVVEILSDYHSEYGVSVALLEKIKGHCCVFGRMKGGVGWKVIRGKDRLMFSHRIPSVSFTTNNPNDVNLFELDPASLPPSLRGR